MRFDPHEPESLFDKYRELKLRKAYFPDEDLLRFLIMFMAPDSPYSDEKDWDMRLDGALSEFGLDRDSPIADKFMNASEESIETIFQLFKLYNTTKYNAWFALKQSMWIVNTRLTDSLGLKDGDRFKAMEKHPVLLKQIIELEFELFNEDYVADMIRQRAAQESLGSYAESFAQEVSVK